MFMVSINGSEGPKNSERAVKSDDDSDDSLFSRMWLDSTDVQTKNME